MLYDTLYYTSALTHYYTPGTSRRLTRARDTSLYSYVILLHDYNTAQQVHPRRRARVVRQEGGVRGLLGAGGRAAPNSPLRSLAAPAHPHTLTRYYATTLLLYYSTKLLDYPTTLLLLALRWSLTRRPPACTWPNSFLAPFFTTAHATTLRRYYSSAQLLYYSRDYVSTTPTVQVAEPHPMPTGVHPAKFFPPPFLTPFLPRTSLAYSTTLLL